MVAFSLTLSATRCRKAAPFPCGGEGPERRGVQVLPHTGCQQLTLWVNYALGTSSNTPPPPFHKHPKLSPPWTPIGGGEMPITPTPCPPPLITSRWTASVMGKRAVGDWRQKQKRKS